MCVPLWSWCVRAVWCGTLKTLVCTFKTSPCVPAPRPHVVTLAGRGASTHGDVMNVHMVGRGGGEEEGERGSA